MHAARVLRNSFTISSEPSTKELFCSGAVAWKQGSLAANYFIATYDGVLKCVGIREIDKTDPLFF
jgi:hypothetical protein